MFIILASKSASLLNEEKLFIANYIHSKKITTIFQIQEALLFFKTKKTDYEDKTNLKYDFENRIGLGIQISQKEIQEYVVNFVSENLNEVKKKFNHKDLVSKLKLGLKFANAKQLFEAYQVYCGNLFNKNNEVV